MKIAEEIAKEIDRIIRMDDLSVSIEQKKVFVLGEIAVTLAGLLEVKVAELGAPSVQSEIIRCKDCRNNHWCNIQEAAMAGDNFFCGAAERRIDE